MKEFTDLISKAADRIKSEDGMIQIVSHYDADGISSAAIMVSTLIKLNKDFHLTIVNRIKPKLISELKRRKPKLVIFTDMGSSSLDEIKDLNCDIIIADHHYVEGSVSENIIHINSKFFDLNLAGAGVTYLLAREILKDNSLAPLAIVGTIGDSAYPVESKIFETPFVEVEKGLNLFGRFSRPIHRTLELSDIPGLSGSPSKVIQFLADLGISIQKNGKWRTLSDLTDEEKRKLADAIVKESLKHDEFKKEDIVTDILTLKGFPDELKDAREFATILNACGRMQDAATGVAVCLKSMKALKAAKGLMKGYKRLIANYLNWVENNPQNIRKTELASYILAGNFIHENLIGVIVSMLSRDYITPLFGLANTEDEIKISARSRGININKVVTEAAETCGGNGGGHLAAAGATIPAGKEEEFIHACEQILKNLVIKEKFIKI